MRNRVDYELWTSGTRELKMSGVYLDEFLGEIRERGTEGHMVVAITIETDLNGTGWSHKVYTAQDFLEKHS